MEEYRLINGSSIEILNKKISDRLKDGWKLYGNPYNTNFDGDFTYYQAMTKDKAVEVDTKQVL